MLGEEPLQPRSREIFGETRPADAGQIAGRGIPVVTTAIAPVGSGTTGVAVMRTASAVAAMATASATTVGIGPRCAGYQEEG